MDIRIIKSPSPGTLRILDHRRPGRAPISDVPIDAIGLVQGKLIDMVVATDIAEKAVGVHVEDISGSCPQNMILIAIYGDTASVEAALDDIQEKCAKRGEDSAYR